MDKKYEEEFSEKSFWKLLKKVAKKIPFTLQMLEMYYCLTDPKTPLWVKTTIIAPLGYFISPLDAIPDIIPIVGWTDDAGVIMAAYKIIRSHITEEHTIKAKKTFETF